MMRTAVAAAAMAFNPKRVWAGEPVRRVARLIAQRVLRGLDRQRQLRDAS